VHCDQAGDFINGQGGVTSFSRYLLTGKERRVEISLIDHRMVPDVSHEAARCQCVCGWKRLEVDAKRLVPQRKARSSDFSAFSPKQSSDNYLL